MRKVVRVAAILAVVLALAGTFAVPYVDALAFIARAAGMQGAAAQIADWRSTEITAGEVQRIPTRHGEVDVRLYRPTTLTPKRAVTIVPGVHMDGIREARLVGIAQHLAQSGYAVLTVATPDLQRFRITPASTDIIEDAALWLSKQVESKALETRADDVKVGMLGISFSGGLSLVAAGRPALRDRVAFVMSFGGHGDLPRVMTYLCSGNAPPTPDLGLAKERVKGADNVTVKPPHDYGVAVVLLGLADRGVVPTEQVEPLRQGITTFLAASSLDMIDKPRAEVEFKRARDFGNSLPEPSRTLMGYVNDRAVDKLGPVLMPVLERVKNENANAALSPERADPPTAPVFLLHGADDNVIPSVETLLLTNYLHDKTAVHAVLSGLVTHAEVDKDAPAIEAWRLVAFWRDLMSR